MKIKGLAYWFLLLHITCIFSAEQQRNFGENIVQHCKKLAAYLWSTPTTIVFAYKDTIVALIKNDDHKKGIMNATYPLHYACEHDLVEVVQFFMHCHVEMNAFDKRSSASALIIRVPYSVKVFDSCTPLQRACEKGSCAVVKCLLQCPFVDRDMKNSYGFTPLYIAAAGNNLSIVKLLLKNGVNKQVKNDYGRDALFVASMHSHAMEIVRELLDAGFCPNTTDAWDDVPLYWANHDCASILLLYGADLNKKNNNVKSFFVQAFENKKGSLIRLFFGYGIDVKDVFLDDICEKDENLLIKNLAIKSVPIFRHIFNNYTGYADAFDFLRRAISLDKEKQLALQREHFFWKLLFAVDIGPKNKACLWAHAFNKGNYLLAAELLYYFPEIATEDCSIIQAALPTSTYAHALRALKKTFIYTFTRSLWKDCIIQCNG